MKYYEVEVQANPAYYWAMPDPLPPPEEWHPFSRLEHATFEIRTGRHPGHALWYVLWSDEFIDTLRANDATGFEDYQVKVVRRNCRVDGYSGIQVLGKGGAIDAERSKLVFEGSTLMGYQGLYMDEGQWDGSDVFAIPGFGYNVFVVERLVAPLQRLNLKNIYLRLHSDCAMP